jgi:DNA-directed RNA polymerase specialized sigma24 family protein
MYDELKERLRSYKKYKSMKNEIELKIAELEQNVGITAMPQSEAISKTYKISSNTENQALQLADNKDRLNRLMNTYRVEVARIENALESLHHLNKQAIELRYIERRNMESVCYIMNRSVNTVKKYISIGLREIDELLNLTEI